MSETGGPAQVQSNKAVHPLDVLRTLSGDDASCVVTAGLADQVQCHLHWCSATHFNGLTLCMSETGGPAQVQSNKAVHPLDVLRTLSGDDASCVVTAGLADQVQCHLPLVQCHPLQWTYFMCVRKSKF